MRFYRVLSQSAGLDMPFFSHIVVITVYGHVVFSPSFPAFLLSRLRCNRKAQVKSNFSEVEQPQAVETLVFQRFLVASRVPYHCFPPFLKKENTVSRRSNCRLITPGTEDLCSGSSSSIFVCSVSLSFDGSSHSSHSHSIKSFIEHFVLLPASFPESVHWLTPHR